MNIIMEYGSSFQELSQQSWDFAFYGESIDQRCESAINYIMKSSSTSNKINYNANNCTLGIDDKTQYAVDFISKFIDDIQLCSSSKVVLECSSLGVAEMLIIIQILNDIKCTTYDAIYVEPVHYSRRKPGFTERRNFDLSTSFEGFKAIPGHALSFESNDKAIVLCGFEAERISRTFDEFDILGKNCQLVFGMPPYTIGWDMNAYVNHLQVIERNNISKEFYYCGAANPLSVYERLCQVYQGVEDYQKLFILPFGTKPMSLGACVFKVIHNNKNNLSLLYDHPLRKKDRSTEIAKWNLYHIII